MHLKMAGYILMQSLLKNLMHLKILMTAMPVNRAEHMHYGTMSITITTTIHIME